jgi:RNA polymerase sigma factor (sigma-70 family)
VKGPTDDEVLLAARGDRAAMDAVVRKLEGLCWHAAKRYVRHTHLDIEELVQQARIAVVYAVRRFRPSFGVAFSSYAYRWMRALCTRLTIKENPSDPRNARHRVVLDKGSRRGRAADSGASYVSRHVSLEDTIAEGSDTTVGETLRAPTVSPEDEVAQREEAGVVMEMVRTLPEGRESLVLQARALGLTLDEVGERHSLSRETVRLIEKRATVSLRRLAAQKGLA